MPKPFWRSGLRLLLLGLVVLWSAFPIALIVMASFKPTATIFAIPPRFVFTPRLENYALLVEKWPDFFANLRNSVIITLGATLLTVVTSTMAGYVYSRYRGRLLTASAYFL